MIKCRVVLVCQWNMKDSAHSSVQRSAYIQIIDSILRECPGRPTTYNYWHPGRHYLLADKCVLGCCLQAADDVWPRKKWDIICYNLLYIATSRLVPFQLHLAIHRMLNPLPSLLLRFWSAGMRCQQLIRMGSSSSMWFSMSH